MSVENHIKNPFEMAVEMFASGFAEAGRAMQRRPHATAHGAVPAIRRIEARDLWEALREGLGDLAATRGDVLFIALIYPLAGLLLSSLLLDNNLLPMIFPLVSGFALLGPLVAIGLYEISRRREQGAQVSWIDGLGVLGSPALGAIVEMGAILLAIFLLWLAAAYGLFLATLGPTPPASLHAFAHETFTTREGWVMIIAGCDLGLLFAAFTFAISVVSFPAILDRNLSVGQAIGLSLRAVSANPGPMSLWGAIVVGALIGGSLPALFGLIFVVPLLGHATWRLYRKLTA